MLACVWFLFVVTCWYDKAARQGCAVDCHADFAAAAVVGAFDTPPKSSVETRGRKPII